VELDTLSQKHLNEVEHCVKALISSMRKAKIQNESLTDTLKQFESQLEQARQKRFDSKNSEYDAY